jgi:hypothetical protein
LGHYAYLYSDPTRNDEPIYAGKGSGNRYKSHLKRVDKHPLTHRIALIRKSDQIPDIIVMECSSASIAFELEIGLIKRIGRRDLGEGSLLNLTNGGDAPPIQHGSSNYFYGKHGPKCNNRLGTSQSIETRTRISNALKGRVPKGGMRGLSHSEETRRKIKESNFRNSKYRGKTWIKNPEDPSKRIWLL